MWAYIAILIVMSVYILVLYNGFVALNNKTKEVFSTIDVYLKKRWNLIPNIVEMIKGYSQYEKNTLTAEER